MRINKNSQLVLTTHTTLMQDAIILLFQRSCIVLTGLCYNLFLSLFHTALYVPQKQNWDAKKLFKPGRRGRRANGEPCPFSEVFAKPVKTWYGVQKYWRLKFEKAAITNKENKQRNTFLILIHNATWSAGTCNCQFINQSLLTSVACTVTAKTT